MRAIRWISVGLAVASFACVQPERGERLSLPGTVEVDEVSLAFEIPGRMVERPLQEGEPVKKGAVVARLDATDLEREVTRATAVVASARAQRDELEHGSRAEEVRQGQAALAGAKADWVRVSADHERAASLHGEGVLPRRDYDASLSALETARARLAQAEEALALLRKGPRVERVDAARAQEAQAEAALALARSRMEKATLLSPLAGIVLSKHAEPGEVLAAGAPVVSIADLGTVWVRAFVEEGDLGRVKVGQRARVATDSSPGKPLEGRISFLSEQAEFTPKSVQTRRERVKLVYRMKVEVPNPDGYLKPGMPVDVELREE